MKKKHLSHMQTTFKPHANNKDKDQPAHLCSLISVVVCCLGSIIIIPLDVKHGLLH